MVGSQPHRFSIRALAAGRRSHTLLEEEGGRGLDDEQVQQVGVLQEAKREGVPQRPLKLLRMLPWDAVPAPRLVLRPGLLRHGGMGVPHFEIGIPHIEPLSCTPVWQGLLQWKRGHGSRATCFLIESTNA